MNYNIFNKKNYATKERAENISPILPAYLVHKRYIDQDRAFFDNIFTDYEYKTIIEHLKTDGQKLDGNDYVFIILASYMIGEDDRIFLRDYLIEADRKNVLNCHNYITLMNASEMLKNKKLSKEFAEWAFNKKTINEEIILRLFSYLNEENRYREIGDKIIALTQDNFFNNSTKSFVENIFKIAFDCSLKLYDYNKIIYFADKLSSKLDLNSKPMQRYIKKIIKTNKQYDSVNIMSLLNKIGAYNLVIKIGQELNNKKNLNDSEYAQFLLACYKNEDDLLIDRFYNSKVIDKYKYEKLIDVFFEAKEYGAVIKISDNAIAENKIANDYIYNKISEAYRRTNNLHESELIEQEPYNDYIKEIFVREKNYERVVKIALNADSVGKLNVIGYNYLKYSFNNLDDSVKEKYKKRFNELSKRFEVDKSCNIKNNSI